MNTLTISLVCLTLGQIQPSQFDPSEAASPVQPAPITSDESYEMPQRPFRLPESAAIGDANEPARVTPARASWSTQREGESVGPRAAVNSPLVPVHSTDAGALAASILDEVLDMPGHEGTGVALMDLLQRLGDSGSRQLAVQSYWRLGLAIAEHNFTQHEARYLSQLPQPQSPIDQTLLRAAIAKSRVRQSTTALHMLERQQALASVARLTSKPLPIDRPFVGPYRTHLETLFAGRSAPSRLQQIDGQLPHLLDVIERQAEAVSAQEQATVELAEAYATGSAGLHHVLDAFRELSQTRRDLLATVLSYNEQIAEYSLAVVGPGVPAETLLGTLIRREAAAQPALLADANVRRASAEAPVRERDQANDQRPLIPAAEPAANSLPAEPPAFEPGSQSVLRRVTISGA